MAERREKETEKETEKQRPHFKLIKSETLPLTPELAEKFRDLPPSPTERDLNPNRVKFLSERAAAGQFVAPTWATVKLGEEVMRMNGQHSSNALCGLNGSFPQNLKVHIDHYEVGNRDDVGMLFRQFDPPKSARSMADVSGAYQGLHEDLHKLPKAVAKLGIDGVVYYRRHLEGIWVQSADAAYELFGEPGLHPFLLWLGEVISIKTPELRLTPVVAGMYATFIASESNARTFWADVARGGDEYKDDAPTTVLDGWLKKLKETKHRDLKPGQIYQGCIFCWNAYRDGKAITSVKTAGKGVLKARE
jgi:hypothetical protein